MATITIQFIDHKTVVGQTSNNDHGTPINLSESIDFRAKPELKRGGIPVTFAGKVAKAKTATLGKVAGFLDSQSIGTLNEISPDFPVSGDLVHLLEGFVARVDVDGVAGAPVYLADDGTYSSTAGTVSIVVGYYKNYDPKRHKGVPFKNRVVEFNRNFQ